MINRFKKIWLGLIGLCIAGASQAKDVLVNALQGDVSDSLGSGAMFWKIFTFASIVLATAAAVKTHNPMVFVGVIVVAFIPAFLLKTFVF